MTFAPQDLRVLARGCVRVFGILIESIRPRTRRVTYWPVFDSNDEFVNHYYRACWYLPEGAGACRRVIMGYSSGVSIPPGPAPREMATAGVVPSHIRFVGGRFRLVRALVASDVIVFWRIRPGIWLRRFLSRICGIKIAYVSTSDTNSVEFGSYPSLLWDHMLRPAARRKIIHENQERFCQIAALIHQQTPAAAAVFGTGPSIGRAFDFDWTDVCTIVCNSIVRDDALLDHIKPQFICAGDAVSHFGVSRYAATFRSDLERQLSKRDLYFFTTAPFGHLFLQHFPALRDRTFLVEHGPSEPILDLAREYALPRLDSTLNIHMLPLAATFAQTIFLLGCDGKAPSGDNEDFWAHAQATQYHDLVESGHRCHPTFNLRRQQTTYERYLRSVEISLDGGTRAGLRYASLAPSHVPPIHAREVLANHPALNGLQKPIPVRVIAERLGGVTPS